MITRIIKKNQLKNKSSFVEPDEIFLDSKNIQNFDRQQFEGRIEKPISKKTVLFLGFLFFIIVSIFGARLVYLQIDKGSVYLTRSQNNVLAKTIIFSDRGIIYDRNKVPLAWNNKTNEQNPVPTRDYLSPGFSQLLGYVSYPT